MTSDPIAEFISREFLSNSATSALSESQPLISTGIIDSVGTMRLVLFLEESYGIRIDAPDISGGRLDCLAAIRRLIAERQSR